MKRLIAVLAVLSFFVSLASAEEPKTKEKKEELVVIKGSIVSLNIPQNQIVIKDSATTYDRVFVVDPVVYETIKLYDAVKAEFVGGSNKIENIKAAPVEKTTSTQATIMTTRKTMPNKKSKK